MSHAANAGPEQSGTDPRRGEGQDDCEREPRQMDEREREYDGGGKKVTEMMLILAREMGNTRSFPPTFSSRCPTPTRKSRSLQPNG